MQNRQVTEGDIISGENGGAVMGGVIDVGVVHGGATDGVVHEGAIIGGEVVMGGGVTEMTYIAEQGGVSSEDLQSAVLPEQ